jgi:hypothetical protein
VISAGGRARATGRTACTRQELVAAHRVLELAKARQLRQTGEDENARQHDPESERKKLYGRCCLPPLAERSGSAGMGNDEPSPPLIFITGCLPAAVEWNRVRWYAAPGRLSKEIDLLFV